MGLITENMWCGSGAEEMAEAANLLSMRVPERHGCFKSLLLRYMKIGETILLCKDRTRIVSLVFTKGFAL